MNPISPRVANGAAASGVTGAVSVLLMYYSNKWLGPLPPEIASAYTTLLMVPAGFLGGYLTKLEASADAAPPVAPALPAPAPAVARPAAPPPVAPPAI